MPPSTSTKAWERWAREMMRRGFTAWQIATRAGVSETRVTQAYHRGEVGHADAS